MSQKKLLNNESILNINLNDLVHSLLRELSMACKKVAIYGSGHPAATRSLEKPFLLLDKILGFKKYVNINLQNGYLFILNIRLKDSVFNQEIIKYMQLSDIKVILFKKKLTVSDLNEFLDRFVKRIDLLDFPSKSHNNDKKNNIDTIEINSETGYRLFEANNQYRGDVNLDFSVKNIVLQLLPDNLENLVNYNQWTEQYTLQLGIDYEPELIQYLIPEKIALIPKHSIISCLVDLFTEIKSNENSDKRDDLLERSLGIYRLIDYHPERKQIIEKLDIYFAGGAIPREMFEDFDSPSGKIRLETREQIDEILNEIFVPGSKRYDTESFSNSFSRLLKTGQRDRAIEITEHLVELLSSADVNFRQEALNLIIETINKLDLLTDYEIFENLIDITIENLINHKETFEYSEFIWSLYYKCFKEKKFELLAKLMAALAQRRQSENNIMIYDSMAIKKVFNTFNQPFNLKKLINEMLNSDFDTAKYIREILITAGSEDIAMELSYIISHPKRQVRQQTLKILGELGKASLKVFSQILVDDSMFEREQDRHELPDNKWYIIRNSIFVLGLLKDREATSSLRLRINDNDIRVRREIISTLEKIGGEDACDILIMMADDPIKEIRESAVITVGLIGTPDIAPLVINLTKMNPKVAIKAINALGKIGGNKTEQYLIDLLDNPEQVCLLAAGEFSKDDVRLAVIKALGIIGNDNSIQKIKKFREDMPTTQKIFFKNSPVNKTINKILSKH